MKIHRPKKVPDRPREVGEGPGPSLVSVPKLVDDVRLVKVEKEPSDLWSKDSRSDLLMTV